MRFWLANTGFKKINRGMLIVIALSAIIASIAFYFIKQNNNKVKVLTQEIIPYIESLEEYKMMLNESKMLTTNWVYLQAREVDKRNLRYIQNYRFTFIKERIDSMLTSCTSINKGDKDSVPILFSDFDKIIASQKTIMKNLAKFDDYENPLNKFESEEIIETVILPETDNLIDKLNYIIHLNRNIAYALNNEVISTSNQLILIIIGFSFSLVALLFILSVFISKVIRKPVLAMKDIIKKLGEGIPHEKHLRPDDSVIGEMVESVNILSDNFKRTWAFANEIKSGNFSAHFDLLSKNDQLGNALVNMRDSLKLYSEEMESKVRERTKEINEKNSKLEEANKEIKDSIAYAKKIQEAILPAEQLIKSKFKDSFIFYKPKDIVSGDFYWFADAGDEILFAVVDCTGHGVPGALMTVIGSSLLNQIVNIGGERSPAAILKELDRRVIETLRQYDKNSQSNDGMDIAMIKYNFKTSQLTYSGAKRSMFLFRNDKLIEIKGSKYPIGSTQYDTEKIYSEEQVRIETKDTLYLFTDGYQDQFGGMFGKKFMAKRFKELLYELSLMKIHDQSFILEKENAQWTGESEQTDDILVAGIRFN